MEKPWLRHYPASVREHLEYPDIPVFALLDQAAGKTPDATAVVMYEHTFTYQQTAALSNKVANALRDLGLNQGDRVVIMLPNCPQFVFAFFGVLKAGGVVAQCNPLYVERELEHLTNDAGAEIIICADVFYPRVKAARGATGLKHVLTCRLMGTEVDADALSFEALMMAAPATPTTVAVGSRDLAVLQYTGGTTGVSKGAMLSHANLVANALQISEWSNPIREPGVAAQEVVLTVLPLFHSYGMTVCLLRGVLEGAKLVLLPRFDLQQTLEAIRDHKVTLFPGVPTIYVGINAHPRAAEYGLSSIKCCNSGAAPLPVEVLEEFEAKTGAIMCEGYGLSEASPVTHSTPLRALRKVGSVGVPLPDTDMRIVDLDTGMLDVPMGQEGELLIRGPQVMMGYWNMPEETAQTLRDGWLYTGDIAKVDEDGFCYIVDRKKDMIIAGGFNIYPRDIDEVLYQHPAVQEAVSAGVPDQYRGETVKAYIVLKPGMNVTVEEIDAFCRERLASFKVPRQYEFRDSLPKTIVGKILRRALVEEERQKLKGSATA